jgi:hypothetical protein
MNTDYRKKVLDVLVSSLQPASDILAAWEGGSAATGTMDEYSDIDLNLLTTSPLRGVLDRIELSLGPLGVEHVWQPVKCFWGEGMMQRVFILKDSPTHFLVDVAVFDQSNPQLLKDFMEIERHGVAPVLFDKGGFIKPGHTDAAAMFLRQQIRAEELKQGFPVFKSLVLKELDRGQSIDAFNFYQNGLVRPYVELLGMLYRPFKFDFGFRYLHKHLPNESRQLVEQLVYVNDAKALGERIPVLEQKFNEAFFLVKKRTAL